MRRYVPQSAHAIDDAAAGFDLPSPLELTPDDSPRKSHHSPPGCQQARADLIRILKAFQLAGVIAQQVSEGGEVIERQHVLGMMTREGLAVSGPAQMNECADPQQKVVGFQIALVIQNGMDITAVNEPFACQRPGAGKEDAQTVFLDVESVQALAFADGLPPLLPPQAADVQEVLKGIVGGTNALAETACEVVWIVNRPHVEEGIELLAFERGDILEIEGQGTGLKAIAKPKLPRVKDLSLKLGKEGIAFDDVIKKEGEIRVRARGHFFTSGPAQRDHSEWLLVAIHPLQLPCPVLHHRRVDGCPRPGDLPTVVELRAHDESIVFGNQPPVSFA